MKKFLLIILSLFILTPAFAADHKVVIECLQGFSTDEPSAKISGKVIEPILFDNGIVFDKGTIFYGDVVSVVEQKRAKRNAYMIVKPTAYLTGFELKEIKQEGWQAKVTGYTPFDLKTKATDVGVSVVNHFVEGVSMAYHFSKGFIKPKEDTSRLKSGAQNAYENSIFSYVSEGKPLVVNKGDLIELSFYNSNVPKWMFWERNK